MKNNLIVNLFLVLTAVVIVTIPLMVIKNSEFGGSDGAAEELITEISPAYEPWFSSLWELPGGEVETLLFSLQSAIGAGVFAFGMGYFTGKKHGLKEKNEERSDGKY